MVFPFNKKSIKDIKKTLVNSFVNLDGLLEIRDTFYSFYKISVKSLMNDKDTKKRFKANHYFWYNRAIDFSEHAINYDPNEKIIYNIDNIVKKIDLLSSLESTITSIVYVSIFVGLGAIVTDSPLKTLIISILIIFVILLNAYKRLLLLDTETIQITNKKLVFGKEHLETIGTKKEDLIAAYIWNRSLCKYSSIPFLTLLVFMRQVSKKYYEHFVKSLNLVLADYMPIYIKNKNKWAYYKYILKLIISKKLKLRI